MNTGRQLTRTWAHATRGKRSMQTSAVRLAVTNFQMPAMSPTMTEGGIASWKKKEGEPFAMGDVLLEIETDKATIDVEAQDDGVLGKILAPDGTKGVPVGKVIALLAEEGDDISNLEAPKDESPPPKPESSQPTRASPQAPPSSVPDKSAEPSTPSAKPLHGQPKSSLPLFPSVLRLLQEHGISNADEIKGTGVRGMLTKGDVLTHLGKASSPLGTFKSFLEKETEKAKAEKTLGMKSEAPKAAPPLDGPALRRLIANTLLESSQKAKQPVIASSTYDDFLADYLPRSSKSAPSPTPVAPPQPKPQSDANPFAGLF